MNILGIGDHVSCGAAILRDGFFSSVVIDERLVREKMVFGVPRQGIAKNLELSGLRPADIDRVAIATVNQHLIDHYVDFRDGWFGLKRGPVKQIIFDTASKVAPGMRFMPWLPHAYYLMRAPFFAQRRRAWQRILRDEFGIGAPVEFVDHHYCHTTSAYWASGFEDCLSVSIDGGGDGLSARVYDIRNGRMQMMHAVRSYDSLGVFYSYITQICGFKAGRHEGKVTGLAARGEPRYVDALRQLMRYENGTIKNVGGMFFKSGLERVRALLPPDFDRADLAASIQVFTEEAVIAFVQYWLDRTGHTRVALSGGLFANVAVNRRIHEMPDVAEVFVFPGMSDEGMPVGAALAACYDHPGSRPPERRLSMHHVYLGPEFSDDEIARDLRQADVAADRHDEVEKTIARLLADGKVVARFNGRMEYGPRALGNRSILYQPNDPSVNDWLNEALQRTEFMPFAPATLWEAADRCYEGVEGARNTARFMTITFLCTPWMRQHCAGVVHVDGTARPQLVRYEDNPSFYRIIEEYQRLTGIPSIINTSFNMHEEPIVCTPSDAIRAFKLGHLDYLAIGNYLAENPCPMRRLAPVSRERVAAVGT